MANRRIQTTELDFDGIKQNLKRYLQGQSQFSDYDFEGSGLSILLDILALNTHYNALYTNLAVNESFLDSASKRASVVSKANELGYIPKSATASTAIVSISMINDQVNAPAIMQIPAFTAFNTNVNGINYTFYTTEVYQAVKNGNLYFFPEVILREGTFITQTIDIIGNDTPIILSNKNIDTKTIKVSVQQTNQSTASETFVEAISILELTSNDPIYFIKELDDLTYQLIFGNGIVGKALEQGNVVTITYLVCNDVAPNGASTFTWATSYPSGTQIFISTKNSAYNGSAIEDIESVRWNAPKSYAAQNRCVTAADYKAIIYSQYTDIRAVNVWGGEENDPPIYGKVFISIVPNSAEYLSDSEKSYIKNNILAQRKVLTITPQLVDAVFLKLELNVTFYYNQSTTIYSAEDISSIVRDTIQDYNATYLNKFGGMLRYSKLSAAIDNSEQSITGNIITLKLHRQLFPNFNVSSGYTINIGNPIYNSGVPEESVLTTGFYVNETSELVYIDDAPIEGTSTGILRLFYINESSEKIIIRNVGTINYDTGRIAINDITITGLYGTLLDIIIKSQSNDVISMQNQFVLIDDTMLNIIPIIDSPNRPYTFASSRN